MFQLVRIVYKTRIESLNCFKKSTNFRVNNRVITTKVDIIPELFATEKKDINNNINNKDEVNYYPNCDTSIWMRSCEKEVIEPINGKTYGVVPKWLKGTLLRNGPGNLKVGDYSFDHLFDSSALLHRFHISDGKVTYQRRFIQTDVYKKNHQAKRIVLTEFGTRAVPDPCQSIFHRVSAIFNPADNASDNTMISVYPFDDEFYTFTEFPVVHKIDPVTLETKDKVNLSKYVGIVNHTSHPHVVKDGTVFNVGLSVGPTGPAYSVIKFPIKRKNDKSMFEEAEIVASVPTRWRMNPSYMHTFGITDNYYIIIEQPLAISFTTMFKCHLMNEPLCTCLKWHDNENTLIHIISRKDGKLKRTFTAEKFFFFHTINQFETLDNDYIVLDLCCYKDAKMLDCMYIDVIKNMHKNPNYAELFRGRPLRFVLPISQQSDSHLTPDDNLIKINTVHQSINQQFIDLNNNDNNINNKNNDNNNNSQDTKDILNRKSSAHLMPNGNIYVKPELLCDLGCETPRFNYDRCLGKEYRYFYAISSDVDLDNPGTIIKVDTATKTRLTWNERGLYPSEPIFVPDPNGRDEDDGVIVSAAVFGKSNESDICLIVIDAKTMKEISRTVFSTPGPVPKCLHGWFSMDK
ncbi:carotenoid isomerooxygenase [Microplitis demolitor]|uniref:carotenoid isomerooxygenase n=1 Tax=Microplitis demolitor TaxID=69319 RepID=UPI0004CD5BC8|nr:carotenoid isomerooxygenase [Microplitis demolitor]